MNRRLLAPLASTLLLAALMPATVAAKAPADQFTKGGIYIVQMADARRRLRRRRQGPEGHGPEAGPEDRSDQRATSSPTRPTSTASTTRRSRPAAARSSTTTSTRFNGFAAKLTAEQATKTGQPAGVLAVSPTSSGPPTRRPRRPSSASTHPAACGTSSAASAAPVTASSSASSTPASGPRASASPTAPARTATPPRTASWPTSRSPAGTASARPARQFNASMCNQKLIGAQCFNAAWGGDAGHRRSSARGSSTRRATTTATARTRPPRPAATTASRRPARPPCSAPISGMAPHARIAMYKALWSTQDASPRRAASPPTWWRPSTRPSPTAWT